MNNSALTGHTMTYLEALATAGDGELLIWGGDIATVSVMACVRDRRWSLMARRHAQGTEEVIIVDGGTMFAPFMLCACCLEPLKDHYAPYKT